MHEIQEWGKRSWPSPIRRTGGCYALIEPSPPSLCPHVPHPLLLRFVATAPEQCLRLDSLRCTSASRTFERGGALSPKPLEVCVMCVPQLSRVCITCVSHPLPQGCIGRGGGRYPHLQGAQPLPNHGLPHAKCQAP